MREVCLKLAGGLTGNHFVALENIDTPREVRGAGRVEDVPGHVITIRPNPSMWVVDEIRSVGQEVIQIVIARRVGCSRNSDALMVNELEMQMSV